MKKIMINDNGDPSGLKIVESRFGSHMHPQYIPLSEPFVAFEHEGSRL